MQQALAPCVNVLSIAGSDSSGGAGIQADLKTFTAHGVHGLCAITAITAQHSSAVRAIQPVAPRMLEAQLDAVAEDFPIAAVKIGMLGSRAAIRTVAAFLRRLQPAHVVLDPVLAASAGPALLPAAALQALRVELWPLASLVTPNLPEAATILGAPTSNIDLSPSITQRLLALGAPAVLLKGGHGTGNELVDWLISGTAVEAFRHPRQAHSARGTGCTLASAIAARLALGHDLRSACRGAIDYLQRALAASFVPARSAVAVLATPPLAPRPERNG